jgi:hypothetical protein
MDLLRTILHGPKSCPSCGAQNFRGQSHCHACGERLINRNPLLRFIVTIVAVGVVGLVIWWKLKP